MEERMGRDADKLAFVVRVPTEKQVRTRIAKRLREIANRRGMSLAEVAREAGISRSHLQNLTSGTRAPTTDVLVKVARALVVDPVSLLRPYKNEADENDERGEEDERGEDE